MIPQQAQRLMKDAKQKSKDVEMGFKDCQYNFRQEYQKAQRTVHVLFHQAATSCDNFYGSIHEGFQCMHDTVTSTDEDKEVALKNRCVMVNDWNTGVMQKQSRIEIHARGNPIQSYEPKLPGKPSTTTSQRSLIDDDLAALLDGCDERSLPDQDLIDIDLNIGTDTSDEDRDDDDDDIYENASSSKYWYTQKVTRKTWPGQIENEVFVTKPPKKSGFFGDNGQQETLDQLIGVFRRNLEGYHLAE